MNQNSFGLFYWNKMKIILFTVLLPNRLTLYVFSPFPRFKVKRDKVCLIQPGSHLIINMQSISINLLPGLLNLGPQIFYLLNKVYYNEVYIIFI